MNGLKTTALIGLLFATFEATATWIRYDINFNASYGAGGSGTFVVRSADLGAMPPTGLEYSPPRSLLEFEANVAGIQFDEVRLDSVFAAADGQASGVTAISNTEFNSRTDWGYLLKITEISGLPSDWYVYDPDLNVIASGDDYTIVESSDPVDDIPITYTDYPLEYMISIDLRTVKPLQPTFPLVFQSAPGFEVLLLPQGAIAPEPGTLLLLGLGLVGIGYRRHRSKIAP